MLLMFKMERIPHAYTITQSKKTILYLRYIWISWKTFLSL